MDPTFDHNDYLSHHGIKGQKWGIRRFQEEDGTLTAAGKERYRTSGNTSGNAPSSASPAIAHPRKRKKTGTASSAPSVNPSAGYMFNYQFAQIPGTSGESIDDYAYTEYGVGAGPGEYYNHYDTSPVELQDWISQTPAMQTEVSILRPKAGDYMKMFANAVADVAKKAVSAITSAFSAIGSWFKKK